MTDINIYSVDETYVRIESTSRPLLLEIHNHFKFFTKNYKFSPKFKSGIWDGTISLFNIRNGRLLKGLLPNLVTMLDHEGYSYTISDKVMTNIVDKEVDDDWVIKLYEKLKGPFEPLITQIDAVKYCINNGRGIILAPTSNGKSYIIHALAAYHALKQKKRVLVVIDRAQLIEQLRENCRDEYLGSDLGLTYSTVYDKDYGSIIIDTADGAKYKFSGNDVINLINNYKIRAKDLTLDNEIDDRWLAEQTDKQIL